jgi:hypothetical protein
MKKPNRMRFVNFKEYVSNHSIIINQGKSVGHIVRKTDRAEIDINLSNGYVFYQQRWQYVWVVAPGQPAWTLKEKRFFHRQADLMVWDVWSKRVTFKATGTSEFARKHAGRNLQVDFDISWELNSPHWTVRVIKVPPGTTSHPTRVEWSARNIFLCTEDFTKTTHAGGVIAHEFGHSMGNTAVLNRGDEYRNTSPHFADSASVINVGRELRTRHFRTMIEELNKMIPGTIWSVSSLK